MSAVLHDNKGGFIILQIKEGLVSFRGCVCNSKHVEDQRLLNGAVLLLNVVLLTPTGRLEQRALNDAVSNL